MRQYAWYSPEFDVLILQSIMEDCHISFEFDIRDAGDLIRMFGNETDPLYLTTWIPLGEV